MQEDFLAIVQMNDPVSFIKGELGINLISRFTVKES